MSDILVSEAPPVPSTASAKRRFQPRLQAARLKPLEHARQEWFADIPADLQIADVMESAYWQHVASMLRPGDAIHVAREDGAWAGELHVMFSGGGEVSLAVYHYVALDTAVGTEGADDVYAVKWRGPGAKFAVVNTMTNETVQDRLWPKAEALKALQQHLAKMRR